MTTCPDDLKELDGEWEHLEPPASPSSGFEPLPKGAYVWKVESVELGTWPNSGEAYLEWELRVLDGPQGTKGRKAWKRSAIAPRNLAYLKSELQLCGLKLKKLSDLPASLDDLLDVCIRGRVALSKKCNAQGVPYRNLFFNQRVTAPSGLGPEVDVDTIPF